MSSHNKRIIILIYTKDCSDTEGYWGIQRYHVSTRLSSSLSLSPDPYTRVAFGNSSQATQMLVQTLCPTWDQTLIFESVPIYGNIEEVHDNPPHVVLELFDKDAVVSIF